MGPWLPATWYGGLFSAWVQRDQEPAYRSFGNGSAMRVAPVAWLWNDRQDVLAQARASAEVTHDHPEGVRGAQCVADMILKARLGATRDQVVTVVREVRGYDMTESLEVFRQHRIRASCMDTLPAVIGVLAQAGGFTQAVQYAASLWGDVDTLGTIVGAVAEALWQVPDEIGSGSVGRMDDRIRGVLERLAQRVEAPAQA